MNNRKHGFWAFALMCLFLATHVLAENTGPVSNTAQSWDGAKTFLSNVVTKTYTVTTVSTAGAKDYTATELLGGLILRDPNGAGRTDTIPAASAIVAAIPGCKAGTAFEFTIRNTADAAETITIAGVDASVTTSGTMTIEQNNTKRFLLVLTNVGTGTEAATLYSLGTVVH